jgi:hypothetical protein
MQEITEQILAEAKVRVAHKAELKALPFYQDTIAMLGHVKLLWNNRIPARDIRVAITDIVRAGAFEPRIFEVLPGLMVNHPHAVDPTEIPDDLAEVLRAINAGVIPPAFRGIEPEKYMVWVRFHADQKKHQHAG